MTDAEVDDIVSDLDVLEEKYKTWRENRLNTISQLQDIADYIDKVTKNVGIAKVIAQQILEECENIISTESLMSQVVGSSGGFSAGVLTLAGGVLTLTTAGAALPVLAAGLGLGVASGLTGGGATLSKHIIKSQQMSKCQRAIEDDSKSTEDLAREVKSVRSNLKTRIKLDVGSLGVKVGNLVHSSQGLVQLSRGAAPGESFVVGAGTLASVFGKNFSDDVAKLLAGTGGRVIAGSVTVGVAGVTMAWDLYSLTNGIIKLVRGEGSQASRQIRSIANQLELELDRHHVP